MSAPSKADRCANPHPDAFWDDETPIPCRAPRDHYWHKDKLNWNYHAFKEPEP